MTFDLLQIEHAMVSRLTFAPLGTLDQCVICPPMRQIHVVGWNKVVHPALPQCPRAVAVEFTATDDPAFFEALTWFYAQGAPTPDQLTEIAG